MSHLTAYSTHDGDFFSVCRSTHLAENSEVQYISGHQRHKTVANRGACSLIDRANMHEAEDKN